MSYGSPSNILVGAFHRIPQSQACLGRMPHLMDRHTLSRPGRLFSAEMGYPISLQGCPSLTGKLRHREGGGCQEQPSCFPATPLFPWEFGQSGQNLAWQRAVNALLRISDIPVSGEMEEPQGSALSRDGCSIPCSWCWPGWSGNAGKGSPHGSALQGTKSIQHLGPALISQYMASPRE